MATIEKDRPIPGKKSAGDSGEVGDGKPPIEKGTPPRQPENPDAALNKGFYTGGDSHHIP